MKLTRTTVMVMVHLPLKKNKALSALSFNYKSLNPLILKTQTGILWKFWRLIYWFSRSCLRHCVENNTLVIIGVNIAVDSLEELCTRLENHSDRNKIDEAVLLAFQKGPDKLLKHYRKANWIYCAVLILDPRHKLETFDWSEWGTNLKNQSYSKFKDIKMMNDERWRMIMATNVEQSRRPTLASLEITDILPPENSDYKPWADISNYRKNWENHDNFGNRKQVPSLCAGGVSVHLGKNNFSTLQLKKWINDGIITSFISVLWLVYPNGPAIFDSYFSQMVLQGDEFIKGFIRGLKCEIWKNKVWWFLLIEMMFTGPCF